MESTAQASPSLPTGESQCTLWWPFEGRRQPQKAHCLGNFKSKHASYHSESLADYWNQSWFSKRWGGWSCSQWHTKRNRVRTGQLLAVGCLVVTVKEEVISEALSDTSVVSLLQFDALLYSPRQNRGIWPSGRKSLYSLRAASRMESGLVGKCFDAMMISLKVKTAN